jgi:DNA-binding NarL/FixJ family response regulator
MGHSNDSAVALETGVFLLTENRLLRESLARVLQKRPGLRVVGASRFTDSAIKDISASQCEVVLTDRLSSPEDLELHRELIAQLPHIKIILFGMDEDAAAFLRSATLGICGYVLKEASASEIVAAVRAVAHGEASCPARLVMALIQHVACDAKAYPKLPDQDGALRPSLTRRQLELVGLVARGMTNKEIAASLNLSEFTVKNHLRRIMKEVDADDRHEAVAMVRAHGLPLAM